MCLTRLNAWLASHQHSSQNDCVSATIISKDHLGANTNNGPGRGEAKAFIALLNEACHPLEVNKRN